MFSSLNHGIENQRNIQILVAYIELILSDVIYNNPDFGFSNSILGRIIYPLLISSTVVEKYKISRLSSLLFACSAWKLFDRTQ